jgi:tetratricopeptide (TPR) repeat protein
MAQKREHWWLPWGDYPPVVLLMVIATLINLLIFITGRSSLPEMISAGDSAILMLIFLPCAFTVLWLCCFYVITKRNTPLIEGGKGTWKYPRLRKSALVGFYTIPSLASGLLGYHIHKKTQPHIIDTGLFTKQDEKWIIFTAILLVFLFFICIYIARKQVKRIRNRNAQPWQYSRLRPWAIAGIHIIPALVAVGIGYYFYTPTNKVVILIADFDGPDPQKYRVTDTIISQLRTKMAQYKDVEIEVLGRSITETEGTNIARTEGNNRKAAMVLWGWYGETTETAPVSVHLEILCQLKCSPDFGQEVKGQIRLLPLRELQSFTLQTDLSLELSYLSLFIVGIARYEANDIEGAITVFTDALNQTENPIPALDQSRIYFHRSGAYLRKNEIYQALSDCNAAIKLDTNYADAYECRGTVYLSSGDVEQAIGDFNYSTHLQPSDPVAWSNLGLAYLYNKDYQQAKNALTHSINLLPTSIAYRLRGIVHNGLHEYNPAISDFTKAIELNPDYSNAYFDRGDSYALIGDYRSAESDRSYARKLRASEPDESEYSTISKYDQDIEKYTNIIKQNPNDADAYFRRGMAYSSKGDYERAIQDLTKSIALEPVSEAYNNRGYIYAERGNYNQAISDFNKSIELDPEHASSYYNLGVAYSNLEDYQQAIACFSNSIKIEPDKAITYHARGMAYNHIKESNKAINDFNKAIEMVPMYTDAYISRAKAYDNKEDYIHAISDYDKALQLQPNNNNIFFSRGDVYRKNGDYKNAFDDFSRAIILDSNRYEAYVNRSQIYKNTGDYNHAMSDIEEAIKIKSDSPEPYYIRGLLHNEIGNDSKAEADFRKFLQISTDSERNKEVIEFLKEIEEEK